MPRCASASRAQHPRPPSQRNETDHDRIHRQDRILRAFEGFTVDAASDQEAIERAKAAALAQMEAITPPEHIDFDGRREGVIAFIDQITPEEHRVVGEDVECDTEQIHDAPAA